MKQGIYIILIAVVMLACTTNAPVEQKKSQLDEKKSELAALKDEISTLEMEITALDPNFGNTGTKVLVATLPLSKEKFSHQIEVRGTVKSKSNVLISAETMGRIENIYVDEGEEVKKGQVLMTLDASILQNSIAEVNTQLELAQAIFDRQANLWKQNIGTEIQYLQVKTNKESLDRRLNTLKSQLDQARIVAPFDGSIDDMVAKVGEMAQPGLPLIRLVNPRKMYIKADVSEAHLGKFSSGDDVEVLFPVSDERFYSKINSIGRVINPENRTYALEISLPSSTEFRPNQVAIVNLTDYINEDAITVPTRLIQTDNQGKFVYKMATNEKSQVAKKAYVSTGLTFKSKTEILDGLTGNEKLIDKGYRDVTDGSEVKLVTSL